MHEKCTARTVGNGVRALSPGHGGPERLTGRRAMSTGKHVHENHDREHGEGCGHVSFAHRDHVDYVHDGHRHAAHGDHYDEH